MADYREAELEAPLRALLDYCVKLTRQLGAVTEADIEDLRGRHGWSDEAIHDAIQVTGFFNYYTRLAEGLGVKPEGFMMTGRLQIAGEADDREQDEGDDHRREVHPPAHGQQVTDGSQDGLGDPEGKFVDLS